MSKKAKIIIGVIVAVLLVGGGVFGYLVYTGKIGLKAATPVRSVTKTYNYPNDPGCFTRMSVTNLTAARGTNAYGALRAKRGDVLKYNVTFKNNTRDLKSPFIYDGYQDAANTNFSKTMSIVNNSWKVSYSPVNNIKRITNNYNKGTTEQQAMAPVKIGKSSRLFDYKQPVIYWMLVSYFYDYTSGGPGYARTMKKAATVTFSFQTKVKSNAPINAQVKNGWAAGWWEPNNSNWRTYFHSGDGKYGHIYVQIIR
jgi:hypothetical protein